jgi:hypothetical protein
MESDFMIAAVAAISAGLGKQDHGPRCSGAVVPLAALAGAFEPRAPDFGLSSHGLRDHETRSRHPQPGRLSTDLDAVTPIIHGRA